MLKVIATDAVISKGYDGAPALKYSESGESVRFRIGPVGQGIRPCLRPHQEDAGQRRLIYQYSGPSGRRYMGRSNDP